MLVDAAAKKVGIMKEEYMATAEIPIPQIRQLRYVISTCLRRKKTTELKSHYNGILAISVHYKQFAGPSLLCCINAGYDSINENTTGWSVAWTVTTIYGRTTNRHHDTALWLTASSAAGSIH